jgi:hypothetical protein
MLWPTNKVFRKKNPTLQKALGASILESLAAQRATIERSRERLAETDGSLAAGGRALKRMGAWFPWLGRQD